MDFPACFVARDPRRRGAGAAQYPLTSDQYAYAGGFARALFILEALPVVKDMVGRMSDLEHVVVSQRRARPQETLRRAGTRGGFIHDRRDPCGRAGVLALFVGLDRARAACVTCIPISAATANTYARQVLGIREDDVCSLGGKAVFAYGLGNALTFPMSVGATTVLNSERPTPAVMFAAGQ